MPRTLSVVGMGAVRRNLLDVAAAGAAGLFDLATVIDAPLAEPSYAFNPSRKQFHATAIVRKLGQMHLKPGRDVILAVGELDFFEPEADWIYGDGDAEFHAAVVGVHRLRNNADEDRLARRVRLVASWAVGLSLGLRDCDDMRCAMHLPAVVDELDRRTGLLCNSCRGLLSTFESA